jgi:hypothetical protein
MTWLVSMLVQPVGPDAYRQDSSAFQATICKLQTVFVEVESAEILSVMVEVCKLVSFSLPTLIEQIGSNQFQRIRSQYFFDFLHWVLRYWPGDLSIPADHITSWADESWKLRGCSGYS